MSVRRAADDPDVMDERRVAVIDLGSNSWRVVVFTYSAAGWWKRTDELYETVRIGAGTGPAGELSEEAIARGVETLVVFARFCHASGLGGEDVLAVATSAIRDAPNRDQFLSRARAAIGEDIEIEVLSAEDEARYGYVAAVNTSTILDGVVLELGGGSLQLVHVANRRAQAIASFPLGAVTLTERFLEDRGAARKKDLERVRSHVRDQLAGLDWLTSSGARLVGTGGAVRNLASAAEHATGGSDLGVQGFVIAPQRMRKLVRELAEMSIKERAAMPGIKPGRGDIILAGALVLEVVTELGSFSGIEVTEAGLREGVFFARKLLASGEPLFDDVRASAVRNLALQREPDMAHTEHVATLALQMHDSLVANGLFDPSADERELLWAAAMLHDVGMSISYDDHHKHSSYLIATAELPGFDPRERALIAQIARYHRKGTPKLGELSDFSEDGDEELLERCSVILRLAEHLERGRDQSVREARLRTNGEGVDLHLDASGDITLPRWSVERYGDDELFERVFGRRLLIG